MKSQTSKSPSYRDFLYEEFKKRRTKEPSYSLRGFARDLEMNPSRLSEIMNGKVGLSDVKGMELADRIGLTDKECEYFLDLIRAEHARSALAKKEAQERVREHQKTMSGLFDAKDEGQCLAVLQLVQRTSQSAQHESIHDDESSSRVFAMNSAQLAYAKDRLQEFHSSLVKDLQAIPGTDKVYGLSLQLFEANSDAD
ncbi:hypothetical protein [Bdellovibrio sp. HCB209]|uniref:hypothetical protein n=1 Tax=Bdellovibrio sp. HCB209 TaxID=3394354 RepID=UPI0039B5A333